MPERQLVTIPKPQVSAQQIQEEKLLQNARSAVLSVSERDMYNIGGRRAPTAHLVREMAKLDEQPISYEILDFGKDTEKAWVKIRGWKGPKNQPVIVIEDGIVHVFKLMLVDSIFEAIANGLKVPTGKTYQDTMGRERSEIKDYRLTENDWEIGADGWPVLTNRRVQLQLMKNHLQKIQLSERDAITKCERRVLLKLMGKYNETKIDEQEEEVGEEDEPKTLDEYKARIYTTILELAGGDKVKAGQILIEVSRVGDFLPVQQVAAVDNLEHASEILARVRQKIIETEGAGE